MKNIAALALLSIALVSCNKETKTVAKVDPATGKTVTVEVPAEETKPAAAAPVSPAVKDSAGVFTQSFKLEKGKTYPLTTYTRNVQTMTDPSGKSMSGTSESTDEMSFVVDDFQNGVYDITINLIGKRNSQTANGKTIVVDTKQAAPKDQNLKMMWSVNKALVGNKLKMKLKENGDVVSVTGFEPIYTKVSTAVSPAIKDQKQRTEFLNSFKSSFNDKMIREQFTKNLMVLPKKGAKIGAKWTESENASPDGKIKLTSHYTLKNVDDKNAVVTVSGGIPYKSDKRSQEGMTHSISSEMSQQGTVTIDRSSGWISNQNLTVKTTQTESISDGKQTQTVKSVQTSTVMVNPAAK